MTATALKQIETNTPSGNWRETAHTLCKVFANRASEHDKIGDFVSDNYSELRDHRFFSAGIPAELGGGGATYEELASVIRELGRHCGSTALSFAMHTHPVAANVVHRLGAGKRVGTVDVHRARPAHTLSARPAKRE